MSKAKAAKGNAAGKTNVDVYKRQGLDFCWKKPVGFLVKSGIWQFFRMFFYGLNC